MGIFLSDKVNSKGQRIFRPWVGYSLVSLVFLTSFMIFIGIPLTDKYRQTHPVYKECVIESAEVRSSSSGTGGIATSSTEVKIDTDGCGTVYVDYVIEPKKSYKKMAAELNQHQGERVTLIFPPFQWPGTRSIVLTGYGYRL